MIKFKYKKFGEQKFPSMKLNLHFKDINVFFVCKIVNLRFKFEIKIKNLGANLPLKFGLFAD